MKRILLTISLLALILSIKTEAKAQVSATSPIAVSIATVTELTANNTTLSPFVFTTGADLLAGLTQANAVNLAYKSNKQTTITIKAQGTGFFSSTTGSSDMPVSVISWKKNGVGSFVPLSTTATVLSGSQAKGSDNFGVDYKITPTLAYDPATDYNVTIEYTLTAL